MMKKLHDRFWKKVQVKKLEDCWEWSAALNASGYGWFNVGKKSTTAHRVAAWISHKLPELNSELHVLHKCDNPKCCNPNHLFTGTNADNAKDKAQKKRGRTTPKYGAENPAAKLTLPQVDSIKKKYAEGNVSQTQLAMEYKMKQSSISRILSGTRWGEVS